MEEVIKLILPFLSAPKNYAQLLKKLAMFALYETFAITLILRTNHTVDAFFTRIEAWGTVGNIIKIIPHYDAINVSGIVIAIVVAVLSLMFKFHDRISDALGIRKVFDLNHILVPLATRVGVTVTPELKAKMLKKRASLMGAVFYKYATSSDRETVVDKHDIGQALGAWSWFWVCVEAVTYFSVGAIVAFIVNANGIAEGFLVVIGLAILTAIVLRMRLPNLTRPEIDQIVADKDALAAVKAQFDAL